MTDRNDSEERTNETDEGESAESAGGVGGATASGEVATEPAAEGGGEVAGSADELEALRSELSSLNDRHLRLAAEFDNFRKRNARERSELTSRSQAELVGSLLEVVDDLQRVTQQEGAAATVDSIMEGIELVERKFLRALENAGLESMEPVGEPFDPNSMEALMTVPTDDPEEENRVADVFQKGYRFQDILIRPARVRVNQYEEPAEDHDGD